MADKPTAWIMLNNMTKISLGLRFKLLFAQTVEVANLVLSFKCENNFKTIKIY